MTPAASFEKRPRIRVLEFKFLGSTDFRGARTKIIDRRFKRSVTIPYDYEQRDCGEHAWAYLAGKGWPLVALSYDPQVLVVAWDGSPHMLGGES